MEADLPADQPADLAAGIEPLSSRAWMLLTPPWTTATAPTPHVAA